MTMIEAATDRLVEMTFAEPQHVKDWLQHIGLEARFARDGGQAITIYNPHLKITTAFVPNSDPTTRAVSLAFATASAQWPVVYSNLLTKVNKEWQRRRKANESIYIKNREFQTNFSKGGKN